MLSIKSVLTAYRSHLPATWTYDKGLRTLFPPGYTGSISPLRNYVIFVYCQLATQGYNLGQSSLTESCIGHFWLGVDGQGNWYFAWIYGESYLASTYARQAGFVFKYSFDSNGRGFVDTSRPAVDTLSCHAGNSVDIKNHWPEMLPAGVRILFQLASAPDPNAVWALAGFGANQIVRLDSTQVTPSGGPSGSSLFPFPANVPANALEPPNVSTAVQSTDGVDGGGTDSFSTNSQDDAGDNPWYASIGAQGSGSGPNP